MKNEVKVYTNWQWPQYRSFKYENDGIKIDITICPGTLFAKCCDLVEKFCDEVKSLEGQNK